MKKFFTLFAVMLCCCAQMFAAFEPEDGKQYLLQDANGGLFIVLATGNDSQGGGTNTTAASLAAEGTPFTFTAQDGGFVLSTDDCKYLGSKTTGDVWNADTTTPTVWYIVDAADGHYYINKVNYANKGLGLDNHTQGSGVYTDKQGHPWDIVEYVAPVEHHDVVVTVDGVEYTMLSDGEGNYSVTAILGIGDHTASVTFDGKDVGTVDFATQGYLFQGETVTESKVYICYNPETGEITVSGDGVVGGETPDPEKEYGLFVVGIDGNWDVSNPALKLEKTEDGVYTFTYTTDANAYFSLGTVCPTEPNDWNTFNAYRLCAPGNDWALWKGDVVNLTKGGDMGFRIDAGTWTFTVDTENLTLTVVEGLEAPSKDKSGLFVVGIDGNWDPANPAIALDENEDGYYVFAYTVTEPAWFALGTVCPGEANDWDTFNANRLSAPEYDWALWKGDVAELTFGGEKSFSIQPGYWYFAVDTKAMTITVFDGATLPFAAEEGQAYNIVLVDQPTYGIDFDNTGWASDAQSYVCISASQTPTKLYLTEGQNGWIIDDGAGRYFTPYTKSNGALGWCSVVGTEAYEWTFEGTPEDFVIYREDGKNIGMDSDSYRLFTDKGLDKIVHFQLVPVKTVWNGDITLPEAAATAEELLSFPVKFDEASDIEVTNMGLLAAIFTDGGDLYALAMTDADEAFNAAGNVTVKGSTAIINFVTTDELKASNPALLESAMQRIGGFQPVAGEYTVYVAPKSFKVDGVMVSESIAKSYAVNGGIATGISGIVTENAARIYDMQGRRVVIPAKNGLYIVNGKKVIR